LLFFYWFSRLTFQNLTAVFQFIFLSDLFHVILINFFYLNCFIKIKLVFNFILLYFFLIYQIWSLLFWLLFWLLFNLFEIIFRINFFMISSPISFYCFFFTLASLLNWFVYLISLFNIDFILLYFYCFFFNFSKSFKLMFYFFIELSFLIKLGLRFNRL